MGLLVKLLLIDACKCDYHLTIIFFFFYHIGINVLFCLETLKIMA